jgi:hypothetical protein
MHLLLNPALNLEGGNRRKLLIILKNAAFLLGLFMVGPAAYSQSEVFELDPSQSMSITGKGPGQDAAINPFSDGESYAVVENISKGAFEVRIQFKGEIKEIRPVTPGKTEEFLLKSGYELYLDAVEKARARVEFRDGDQ